MKNKVSITAELAASIKAERDPAYTKFVSKKTNYILSVARFFLPNKFLTDLFRWRNELTIRFDSILEREKPDQIIDIGSGYSLRGYNLIRKNPDVIYIDTDLLDVTRRKKKIIEDISENQLNQYRNLHLLSIDVLKDNIQSQIQDLIGKDKKTVLLAEGLTSYFQEGELKIFFENISNILRTLPGAVFYSNLKLNKSRNVLYRIIRKILAVMTGTWGAYGFKNKNDFRNFIETNWPMNCQFVDDNLENIIFKLTTEEKRHN